MQINNNYQTTFLWNNVNAKKEKTKTSQTQSGLSINMAENKRKDDFKLSSDMNEKLRKIQLEEEGIIDSKDLVAKVKSSLVETQSDISKITDLIKSSQNKFLTDEDREAIQNDIKQYQDNIDKTYKSKIFDKLDNAVNKMRNLTSTNQNLIGDSEDAKAWEKDLRIIASISTNSAQTLGLKNIDVTNQNEESIENSLNACKAAKQTISTQFETITKYQGIIENIDLAETQDFLTNATTINDILDYSRKLVLHKSNQNKLDAYKLSYIYTNSVEE